MTLVHNDDFDDLFDEFKMKKKSKTQKKAIGIIRPDNLPIWKDVKSKASNSTCMVCRQEIDDEDIVEVHDYCDYYFHYKHIREWLKIKGVCPVCKHS